MKAHDVITLTNKAKAAMKAMSYHWDKMIAIDKEKDQKGKENALRAFLREKEQFCTLMDAIHVVSKDAGREFRMEGWGRDDS